MRLTDSKIVKGIIIVILCIVVVWGGITAFVWMQYKEPSVLGGEVLLKEGEKNSVENITKEWFGLWVAEHEGWKVPLYYRVKSAEITSLEQLEDGCIEVHYQVTLSRWAKKLVQKLELSVTSEENVYEGQWVLKWERKREGWKIGKVMTPVQYQIQSPEFAEEMNQPQTAHFAYNTDKEQSYYAKDEVLYVTYDGGKNFIQVPDGYEQVFQLPNGTYDEYLSDNNYLISSELTAFIGYSDGRANLIYSTDEGKQWNESVIFDMGYHANAFLSKTENYVYATFAVERTGGSDYYGTFRSSDLENWENVPVPMEIFRNASCVYWKDDNTGYYGDGSSKFYMTKDGGTSYEIYDLPKYEKVISELGYNPYDCPEGMYTEKNIIYMIVGQGDDGDYARDGKPLKALFKSEDGIQFSFVKEFTEDIKEAG